MTRKYVDGLPLYRQEKIWVREGVALSRATMANWIIQTAQTWLKPLYRLPCDRRLRWVQPGHRSGPLRLLGAYAVTKTNREPSEAGRGWKGGAAE